MAVVALPDGRVVEIEDADLPGFEAALAAETQAAQAGQQTPVDIQGAARAAQQEVADNLTGTQKVLVGIGKTFNDVISGVAQLTNPDVADQIGKEIASQREIYDILDGDEVGLEDLGEIIGDAAMFAVGGAGAATVKGGALLGGIIEGLKSTVEGEKRAEQAAGGAFGGAVGGVVGRLFTPSPAADKIAEGAIKGKGLVDFVVGGAGRMLGMSKLQADRYLMRGASSLLHQGKQIMNAPVQKPPSGQVFRTAVSAKQTALAQQRQKQINDLGVEMLDRAAEITNAMSSRGKAGVLLNETNQTLQDLVTSATKQLPDGRVGLSYGDFVKSMAQFSNKHLKDKLGDAYSKQLRTLVNDMKSRADEIVGPEQIAAEVSEYADLILKGDINVSELGPPAVRAIMGRVRQAGQAAAQQAARAPALGAQAGTQDVTPGGPGVAILNAAQGLAQ